MPIRRALLLLILLCPSAFAKQQLPFAEPDPDEALLTAAGLKTDGASLLAFLRARTLTKAGETRLRTLVRQLGDRSYRKRTQATAALKAAGRSALPFVRPATHSHDPEVAWRAKQCVQVIDSEDEVERVLAVTRLLAKKRPVGGAAALLAYVPFADDERIEDELCQTLKVLAWHGDHADPVLVQALHDPQPLKRSAAALAIGSGKDRGLRRIVRGLLHDSHPIVRLRAAQGLLTAGDKEAVPPLIELLAEGPKPIQWQAENLLCNVAGTDAPAVSLGEPDSPSARQVRAAWAQWWAKHKDHIDLAQLSRADRVLGLTLIVTIDGYDDGLGQIEEVARNGHALWTLKGVNRPMDARLLPHNRILVAEYGGRIITIRERHKGHVLKTYHVQGNPSDVQLLPNGDIFCALWPNGLIELTAEGKQVFSYRSALGSITSGQRLKNGHMVYVTQNGFLAEIDAKGKEIRKIKFTEPIGWRLGLDVLPGPRYLVAHQGANKVIEYDKNGKPLWQCAATNPTQVTRLKNGHTLITCNDNHVIEVNRAGKVVWEKRLQGRPFRARGR
jgi:hypothetical protein